MPLAAPVRADSHGGWVLAANEVHAARDRLEVRRVDACMNTAEVVGLMATRNDDTLQLKGDLMRLACAPIEPELAVAPSLGQ
jgi:hypothetical protein